MSLSDPSCRILIISSSLDGALAFIQRIKADDEREHSEPEYKIPWTITNKYYSANVHFAAHTVNEFSADLLEGVPAVVFVWTRGEAYRDDVEKLSVDIQEYEPEVSLAVRIDGDDEEENGEIDQFLSSRGFEYVWVRDDDGDDDDDVPNFPRVIDALSTVMWPSMKVDGVESDGPGEVEVDSDWEWSPLDGEWTSEEVAATHERIFGDDGNVLERLEEIRAEITAVEDLDERRRAAAVVALSVVYGL